VSRGDGFYQRVALVPRSSEERQVQPAE